MGGQGLNTGVRDAVKSGRITEQRIEESARKLLAAKYDLGLVEQRLTPIDTIDRTVGSKDVVALATEIAEHAITLVRDDDKLVPLKNLKPESRVFNLAVTNGDDRNWIANAFVWKLKSSGVKVETVVLDERSSEQEAERVVARLSATELRRFGYARLARAAGIELPGGACWVLAKLSRHGGAMPGAERVPPQPLVAVNLSYAAGSRVLDAHDEVALIPPVAGG